MSFLLSVIIPAYNEEENIPAVIAQVSRVLESLGWNWEVVMVDDGSQDQTFELIREAAARDHRIRGIRLSRNFGSHVAITAGLEHATGDTCLVTTADLEESPTMIPRFVEAWRGGAEIVWGVRTARKQSLLARSLSAGFHTLFGLFGLAQYSRQVIGGGFFLVDRKVVDALRSMRERNRTIIGLLFWMGFRHGYVPYEPSPRHGGRSKWTLGKRIKLAIDSFVGFSYVPIRAVSMLGGLIALVSLAYALWIIWDAVADGVAVQGWPTLMVTVLFLSGLQLLVTGMMGEYLWRALDESRGRPLYIMADSVGLPATPRPMVRDAVASEPAAVSLRGRG